MPSKPLSEWTKQELHWSAARYRHLVKEDNELGNPRPWLKDKLDIIEKELKRRDQET